MHIVFYISTGGGPEAMLKNISSIFEYSNTKITIILDKIENNRVHRFPENFNLVQIKSGAIIIYYLQRFFGRVKWLKPKISYIIRSEREKQLLNTLIDIDSKDKIDIVEVSEGQFINKIYKRWKVITRAHGSNWSFRMFCEDQDNSIDDALIKWQKRQHLLSARNYAISQHTKEHLTKVCSLPENLIQFLPYPIPLEKFRNALPAKIDKLPNTAPLILSIGRLEKRKGMDTLVKAMPEVWKKYPKARLLLLGKETEFTIEQLRLMVPSEKQGYILYPGFVHYDKVPSYYKAATIYVSASQYETFGYTLLEAMASGTPVICTDRGAIPELVTDKVNGLVVPYGDSNSIAKAINLLLNNKLLLTENVEKGRKIARNFDIEIIGIKMLNSYKELVT